MIITPVTSRGRNYDVEWKRGKDGPKITAVYVHNTDDVIDAWQVRTEEFSKALAKALPGKRLHR
jgi:hypothetical protein